MKRFYFLSVLGALLALSGCMEQSVYQGPKEEEEKEYNEFDFSTVSATSLEVSYLNTGVQAAVYFELYDEMPVTVGEYSYTKRDDVTPLFAAYTGKDGVYKNTVELPAYLKKVYIYTPAFYAKTLIEAEVTEGAIKATDAVTGGAQTRMVTTTDKEYDSYMVTETKSTPNAYKGDTRWQTWLGDYSKTNNGEINYKYAGNNNKLKIPDDIIGDLYTEHTKYISADKKHCVEEYRRYTDMHLEKEAEVAITFLGQNTGWCSSMGYYCYEGNAPTDLNNVKIIMLFPNTQDGLWTNGNSRNCAGIDRKTIVQLKYYPNGTEAKGTTTFPAGINIGFVIATNAWSNHCVAGDKKYRAATSSGLSVNNNGNHYNKPRTAALKINNYIMISFEDHTDDENFSDIVVTMTTDPKDAIPDIPDPKDPEPTETLKGIYAFEDLWPAKGDYDMNDVMVRYDYAQEINTENRIKSESFIFKTFQNYASLQNGLAVKMENGSAAPSSIKCEIRKAGENGFTETDFTYETAGNVFLLTDDVKQNMGAEYKLTFTYATPIAKGATAKPFIYRNTTDGKRWEVHIVGEAPTSKIDTSYFNIAGSDDASKPDKGIYYVRSGNYPFAFFLAGANEKNLEKMLIRSNESKKIDELYPGYNNWVNGGGSADWYK